MPLLSGNEAIAEGAISAGVHLAVGYPGTPTTEIIDSLKKKQPSSGQSLPLAHWAINEKVALEMAVGVSYFGKRALCTMKHVGVNVASDALMTFSYTGVDGGAVIVTGDDPHMFSSQNEQDNRNYASFSKLPMLEPSDSEEAFWFTLYAFEISEAFDSPVFIRITTRVAHSTSFIEADKAEVQKRIAILKKKITSTAKNYVTPHKNWEKKKIMLPSIARVRHRWVEDRLELLRSLNEKLDEKLHINHLKKGTSKNTSIQYSKKNTSVGIDPNKKKQANKKKCLLITAGVPYLYAREAFPEIDILKIGMIYPLPTKKILEIARNYNQIMAIEELDPFLENQLLIMGIDVLKKNRSFYLGELSSSRVKLLFGQATRQSSQAGKTSSEKSPISITSFPKSRSSNTVKKNPSKDDFILPSAANPPRLCSGCPHLTIANLLKDTPWTVSGDIGCYTLTSLDPFNGMDSVLSMGSSISILSGMAVAYDKNCKYPEAKIAVIGDSTLLHGGIPALIESSRLNQNSVICVLDNGTTAMTGRQPHPGSVIKRAGEKDNPLSSDQKIDFVKLVEALGVKQVYRTPSYQFGHSKMIFQKALEEKGLSIIVFEEACALLTKQKKPVFEVKENCVRCGSCLEVGCPSIAFDTQKNRPSIDSATCIGCGICASVCDYDALTKKTNATLFDFLKIPS